MTQVQGEAGAAGTRTDLDVVVADYGGYPFTLQLADRLALRGHRVTYVCRDVSRVRDVAAATGTGRRSRGAARLVPIDSGGPLEKGNLLARWRQERRFGGRAARLVAEVRPDAVLSANMPLDAQAHLQKASLRVGGTFVYWLQDLIGTATHQILRDRFGAVGALVGTYYLALERRLLRRSDAVVAISDSFRAALEIRGVPLENVAVVPNWSPLDELPECGRDNSWARERGFVARPVVMYSGSLGMKHDPGMLAHLARRLSGPEGAHVVVVAEGAGARWLASEAQRHGLTNLHVFPFQERSALPQVLGTADVLVALLEPSAGTYSIPSKILSYLCAGRAVVAAVPEDNDVARLLRSEDAGIVCEPTDATSFETGVRRLLSDTAQQRRLGRNGRAYAERNFDIDRIAVRFESILAAAAARRSGAGGPA